MCWLALARKRKPLRSLEFVFRGTETALVLDTIKAAGDSVALVMKAVMNALDKTG